MRKKKVWVLSLLAAVALLVSGYLLNAGLVFGDVGMSGDEYVTNIRLTDSTNTEITSGGTMEMKAIYNLDYDWELPDNTFNNGDELEFSIPDEFKVVSNFRFNLYTDGEEVARVDILGNANDGYYIKMTFTTDYVETHSDVSGTFNFSFILNDKYVKKDSDNTVVFPPDIELSFFVPDPGGPGEGGSGQGGGESDSNLKSGKTILENLKDSPDITSTIFEWEINLGKDTLLQKVGSFDEIDHIYIEDKPQDQRMIAMYDFKPNWPEAYAFDGATYTGIPWEYDGVPDDMMDLTVDDTGSYYDGFKIDILPQVKKYNDIADENGTDMIEYEFKYYSVPVNEVFEDTEFSNQAKITIVYNDGDEDSWVLDETVMYNLAEGTIKGKRAGVEFTKVDSETGEELSDAVFDLYKLNFAGDDYVLIKSNLVTGNDGVIKVDKLTTGKYAFDENKAPDGYELEEEAIYFEIKTSDLYDQNQQLVYKNLGNVENVPNSSKIEVNVEKKWNDKENQDNIRPPSIVVSLYADGAKLDKNVTLNAGNRWKHTWTDLDEKSGGEVIEYTVKEQAVPGYSGQTVENSEGNYTITNTHKPDVTSIDGIKTWNDKEDQDGVRPTSIRVNLLADNVKIDYQNVTAKNNWKYSFTELPKNKNGKAIKYTITEDAVPNYTKSGTSPNLTNSYTPGQTSIKVTKVWQDNNDQDKKRPSDIKAQLYANDKKSGAAVTLNAGNKWQYEWKGLAQKSDGKDITYTVKEVGTVPGYELKVDDEDPSNVIFTNIYTPETTQIEGEKIWEDNNNQDGVRPDKVTVNLLADGKEIDEQVVTAKTNWKYEFKNLPKYNNGKIIKYTITEDRVPEYDVSYTGTTKVINTHAPGKTNVSVHKSWVDEDNQDGVRPLNIKVQLYADGKKSGAEVTLNKGNDWNYQWKNLDQKSGGKDITYTVKEVGEVKGYDLTVNDKDPGNIILTNTYKPETTSIGGIKTWNDKENQDGKRPASITVNLLADGKEVDEKIVTEKENWTYEFTNLPKKKDGKPIVYTVTEDQIPDYSVKYDGKGNIINSYVPGQTSVTVTKDWDDKDNQDGLRTSSVKAQLYANDKKSGGEVTLNQGNNWTYTWEKLELKADGQEIVYTVKEVGTVPGYDHSVNDEDLGNILLINSYTPETTKIGGVKTWNDKENQDGKRPTSITVNLLADGLEVDEKVVTAKENWTYEFTNLPKKQNGKIINYTITEDQVLDYTVTYDGKGNITNTYLPGQTNVKVTKNWEDKNNQDGIRPTEINVQLYADGKKSGAEVTLNQVNSWSHQWDDLEQKADGKNIKYTVQEVGQVTGYEHSVNDKNPGNITITNTHTPELTSIGGEKKWVDKENENGQRPDKITVNLLADGKEIDEKVVTAKENWTYEFTNLPKYKEGKVIKYSVTEDQVADYTVVYDGKGNITNTYVPGQTSVTVTKDWQDKNNQDGLQPQNINAQLYANDEKSGAEVTLNQGNEWTYTWDGLALKADGKEIVYTVKEVGEIPGYEHEVNNTNPGNIILLNTHNPEVTSITGIKTWNDKENQDGKRPTRITVNLLANNVKIDSQEVTAKNDWKYEFSNLPKYQDGKIITYTVNEEQVTDYTVTYTATGITNTYQPGSKSISVNKVWQDKENQDGLRPVSINVQLVADGKKSGDEVTLNEVNNWGYTWADLAQRADGKDIVYTVEEVGTVDGYEQQTTNDGKGNYTITNNYQPAVINIEGEKHWQDNNNQDGKRPTNITVILLADGQNVDEQIVTAENNWKYEFSNLPKNNQGNEIVYTLTEEEVPGYSFSATGKEKYDITNSYTPGKTSMSVQKVWQDSFDQDGIRPGSINVQLYANGEKSGEEVTLNETNNWNHEWVDLEEKADGKDIVYTVQEVGTITGYILSTNDRSRATTLLTNTHEAAITELHGKKEWADKENQDGKRPDQITVYLLADGLKVDEQVVTSADDWAYSFENLPKNNSGKEIVYTVKESQVPDYSAVYEGTNIKNSYTPGETSVTATKKWTDGDNKDGLQPTLVQLQLYADGEKSGEAVVLNAGNKWTYTWDKLDLMKDGKTIVYTVSEVDVPSGYDVLVNDQDLGNVIVENIHTPEVTSLEGKKDWQDKENQDGKRPDRITVILLADGQRVDDQVVTAANDWAYLFTNLPKNNKGKEINYTVAESLVPDYSVDYVGTNITNTYTPGKTTLKVIKKWEDANNQDGIQPASIRVQLHADGKKSGPEVVLNSGNSWEYQWDDLDLMASGKEITYTVEEVEVPDGYTLTPDYSSPGTVTLVNAHVPETTEREGKKDWQDKDDQDGKRPGSITVNLLADGQIVDHRIVTADNNWSYKFTDLPKNQGGQEIVYTVTENEVPDYAVVISGMAITNSYTPAETSVTVTKAWIDGNNQDGIRPDTITAQLYADGQKSGKEVILSPETNWTHTWNGLDQMANGKKIDYTVQEVGDVKGYVLVTNDQNKGNIILTNTHVPDKTSVAGSKTWNDNNNQDGKRPASITVNLLADGQEVAQKAVTEKDNWTYEFTDLPKNSNGKEIVYTVTENQVPDYSVELSGMDITNNHTPGKTSVTVTKAWDDKNDKDGIRPDSIKVQLYADGEKSGEEVQLNTANKWNHTWTELDEKANGKTIVYVVKEVTKVPGYETVINNKNIGNVIITNSHTPKPDAPKPGAPGSPAPGSPSKPSNSIPKLGESMNAWVVLMGIFLMTGTVGYYQKANRKQ